MFTVTRTDGWMGDPQKSEVVPPIPYLPQISNPADEKGLSRVSGWGVGSKFGTPKTEKISNHEQLIHPSTVKKKIPSK